MLLQATGPVPATWVDLVLRSSPETKAVLAVTIVFSLVSWFIIGLKWWQFRGLRREADRFFAQLEKAPRLEDAYRAVSRLPPSPYTRIFREGFSFLDALRQTGGAPDDVPTRGSLGPTQLEALKMVLGKEIGAERDAAAHFIPWLATIGSVSPLLGLLGTVLGVMDAFIGIASRGSGNLAAVAPGVAEALVTTVAGLAAAIPAVMAYNLYVSRLGLYGSELEGFANELVGSMARERLI